VAATRGSLTEELDADKKISDGVLASNPFYEALNILRDLSIEGEVGAVRRLMDAMFDVSIRLLGRGLSSSGSAAMAAAGTNSGGPRQSSTVATASITTSNNGGGTGAANENDNSFSGTGAAGRRGSGTATMTGGGDAHTGSRLLQSISVPMEAKVEQLEAVLVRGLFRALQIVRRPNWVADAVVKGLNNILRSIAEALSGEAVAVAFLFNGTRSISDSESLHYLANRLSLGALVDIEDDDNTAEENKGKGVSGITGNHAGVNSGGTARKAFRAGDIDLSSLEESLKTFAAPADKQQIFQNSSRPNYGTAASSSYSSSAGSGGGSGGGLVGLSSSTNDYETLLLDLLRGAVILRTQTIPRVWKVACKYFIGLSSSSQSAEGSQYGGNSNSSIRSMTMNNSGNDFSSTLSGGGAGGGQSSKRRGSGDGSTGLTGPGSGLTKRRGSGSRVFGPRTLTDDATPLVQRLYKNIEKAAASASAFASATSPSNSASSPTNISTSFSTSFPTTTTTTSSSSATSSSHSGATAPVPITDSFGMLSTKAATVAESRCAAALIDLCLQSVSAYVRAGYSVVIRRETTAHWLSDTIEGIAATMAPSANSYSQSNNNSSSSSSSTAIPAHLTQILLTIGHEKVSQLSLACLVAFRPHIICKLITPFQFLRIV
jgi:hypothetical protein